jgi:hypothetical protein
VHFALQSTGILLAGYFAFPSWIYVIEKQGRYPYTTPFIILITILGVGCNIAISTISVLRKLWERDAWNKLVADPRLK